MENGEHETVSVWAKSSDGLAADWSDEAVIWEMMARESKRLWWLVIMCVNTAIWRSQTVCLKGFCTLHPSAGTRALGEKVCIWRTFITARKANIDELHCLEKEKEECHPEQSSYVFQDYTHKTSRRTWNKVRVILRVYYVSSRTLSRACCYRKITMWWQQSHCNQPNTDYFSVTAHPGVFYFSILY